MNIFRTLPFTRLVKKNGLTDAMLRDAADEIRQGLIDANLGGGLIKKRIAKPNSGKSSGYRTIVGYLHNNQVIYLYCFEKNQQANISDQEEEALKKLIKSLKDPDSFAKFIEAGTLISI